MKLLIALLPLAALLAPDTTQAGDFRARFVVYADPRQLPLDSSAEGF